MPRVSDLLDRLRPAGAPGPAGAVGVPADRRAAAERELAPVFMALAPSVRAAAEIRAAAVDAATDVQRLAAAQAAAVVAQAKADAAAERASAATRVRADAQTELAQLAEQAAAQADDAMAELAALPDPRTGGRLTDRTVIVANTSNMAIMGREASIYTGVTVAEYYRDMGYHAVVIADSTSRWAEALREFASRTGVLPAEEGYPAGLASALAAFYERAGMVRTLGGATGSVTVIGAVSPPGGDLTEPVTAQTQRFVRTLWTLDRELAYARHYPAVTWRGSYCRDAERLGAWYAGNGDRSGPGGGPAPWPCSVRRTGWRR